MDDKSLSDYIPTVGDRFLLKEFCQTKEKKAKKESLFTILKKKMKHENGSATLQKDAKTVKKHSASKNSRKIQIGWMHEGKVLRSQSGGGTRKLEMDKESNSKDICKVGKELFFKDGTSSQGNAEDMVFSVLDFQRVPMPDGVTISNVHDLSRMDGMLRFYLSTSKKCKETSACRKKSNDKSKKLPNSSESDDEVIVMTDRPAGMSTPKVSDLEETIPLVRQTTSSGSEDSLPSLSHSPKINRQNPMKNKDIVAEALAIAGIQESGDEGNMDEREEVGIIATLIVKVRRGQVFNDMIEYFKGINIHGTQTCEIKMFLPNGEAEAAEDNGGVFRDALSEFWETFYSNCTDGDTVRVPITVHTMMQDEWIAVAKVIYFGYKQEGFFPNRLALPFVKYCYSGDNKPGNDLITSFLHYLPEIDRETIKTALENFQEVDKGELESVLSSMGAQTNVTEENLRNTVYEIAHKDIIQDPAFMADCWRPIFQTHLDNLFKKKISKLYDDLTPTVRKVLNLLTFPDDMSREQEMTTQFLTRFVKGLTPGMLESFLRFCTGTFILTVIKNTPLLSSHHFSII